MYKIIVVFLLVISYIKKNNTKPKYLYYYDYYDYYYYWCGNLKLQMNIKTQKWKIYYE